MLKGFTQASTKSKKIEDIGITNHARVAPEFMVHNGLMMIYYPLICELTEVLLYEQDLMENVPTEFHVWPMTPIDAR